MRLKEARRRFPFIERLFAGGGLAIAAAVQALGAWRLELVKRSDQAKGFVVLPKRWIGERSFAWLAHAAPDRKSLSPNIIFPDGHLNAWCEFS